MAKSVPGKLLNSDDDLRRLNSEGLNVTQLAEHFSVTQPAIRRKLKLLGLEYNEYFKKVDEEKVIEDFEKGSPPYIISANLGVSLQKINRIVNKHYPNYFRGLNNDLSCEDKRFYVYVHKREDGSVAYIGSGSGQRMLSKNGRDKQHLAEWDSLEKVVLKYGLSKQEAYDFEEKMISEHDINTLLNKRDKTNKVKTISYETMSKYFYYDETSPTFLRWKIDKFNYSHAIVKVGDPAGRFDCSGYATTTLDLTTYRVHRIIYCLLHKQDIPTNMLVDHIDGNRSNNNISNLRLVTAGDNNRNRALKPKNKDLPIGVIVDTTGRFRVSWNEYGVHKTKMFNPRTLYPNLPEDLAKAKALKDAIEFRKQMEALYYNKPEI